MEHETHHQMNCSRVQPDLHPGYLQVDQKVGVGIAPNHSLRLIRLFVHDTSEVSMCCSEIF